MIARVHPRVHVKLQCRVSLARRGYPAAEAVTENISRNGVLVRWTGAGMPVRMGDLLTVDIDLPANQAFGPRSMRCRGKVVRMEEGNPPGLAIRIDKMAFRQNGASTGVLGAFGMAQWLKQQPAGHGPM